MNESNLITVSKYFEYLAEEKFMGSKCPHCNHVDFPAKRLCTSCQAEAEWYPIKGDVSLMTYSKIFVGNKFMLKKGYNRDKPYFYAIGKLKEGPMVSGQLINIDDKNSDKIQIGLPLQLTFVKTEIKTDKEGHKIYRTDLAFQPRL